MLRSLSEIGTHSTSYFYVLSAVIIYITESKDMLRTCASHHAEITPNNFVRSMGNVLTTRVNVLTEQNMQ